jgi:hypothetical protein
MKRVPSNVGDTVIELFSSGGFTYMMTDNYSGRYS